MSRFIFMWYLCATGVKTNSIFLNIKMWLEIYKQTRNQFVNMQIFDKYQKYKPNHIRQYIDSQHNDSHKLFDTWHIFELIQWIFPLGCFVFVNSSRTRQWKNAKKKSNHHHHHQQQQQRQYKNKNEAREKTTVHSSNNKTFYRCYLILSFDFIISLGVEHCTINTHTNTHTICILKPTII